MRPPAASPNGAAPRRRPQRNSGQSQAARSLASSATAGERFLPPKRAAACCVIVGQTARANSKQIAWRTTASDALRPASRRPSSSERLGRRQPIGGRVQSDFIITPEMTNCGHLLAGAQEPKRSLTKTIRAPGDERPLRGSNWRDQSSAPNSPPPVDGSTNEQMTGRTGKRAAGCHWPQRRYGGHLLPIGSANQFQ